jgi:pyruvate-formate lyase
MSDRYRNLRSVVRDDRIIEGVLSGDETWLKAYDISQFKSESYDQSFSGEECLALIIHANKEDKDLYCLILNALNNIESTCHRKVGIL